MAEDNLLSDSAIEIETESKSMKLFLDRKIFGTRIYYDLRRWVESDRLEESGHNSLYTPLRIKGICLTPEVWDKVAEAVKQLKEQSND